MIWGGYTVKLKMGLKGWLGRSDTQGFTLLELLVVVLMIGILAAIGAPGLAGWLNRQRLSGANEQAVSAIRSAQALAIKQRKDYRVSFRMYNGRAQVAVHSKSVAIANTTSWEDLPSGVMIFPTAPYTSSTNNSAIVNDGVSDDDNGDGAIDGNDDRVYYIDFNFKGNPDLSQFPPASGGSDYPIRISFSTSATGTAKRCVSIETLIGGLRTSSDSACGNAQAVS
jgi:prepilin-type N-terminal cleavage/methylation domain-containing protein